MSLLTDLLGTLGTQTTAEVASALGESDDSVQRAMPSAMAAVLGGLASKSGISGFLDKVLGMSPFGAGDSSGSSAESSGRNILSMILGHSETRVTEELANGAGVRPGMMSSLLAIAGPIVISFLQARTRNEGMSMAKLGSLLQAEVPAIRSVLPTGVGDLLGFDNDNMALHQTAEVATARGSRHWVLPLALMALVPAIWLMVRPRAVEPLPSTVGTASRSISEGALPLHRRTLDLYFNPGSVKLQPDAERELRQFANSLADHPDSHVAVTAYTDETGSEPRNIRLSHERADAVRGNLIRMGIPADRLTAAAFAGQNQTSDHISARDRPSGNRVSVEVTDH